MRTFLAMLARDARVARRNFVPLMLQTMLQPMLFVFVFGQVMTRSGMMTAGYQDFLLPGIMAITMMMTGIQAVSMPLISEFQFTKEIEDRLLAPMNIQWLAVEKIVAGMLQTAVAGCVVTPAAYLVISGGAGASLKHPVEAAVMALLVALLSSAVGLLMGCSVGQTQIGLLFSLVLAPMIMFGCAYYPWSALASFPIIQKLVLLNPLVYASEGLRGVLTPHVEHMPTWMVMLVLVLMNVLIVGVGLNRFMKKAVG